MKKVEYHLALTSFDPTKKLERRILSEWRQVAAAVDQMPLQDAVVVVEALHGSVDYGNFYIFMNKQGLAHVRLHEHREFLLKDSAHQSTASEVIFKDEDGSELRVIGTLTTSLPRAKVALESWLPEQTQSAEFTWQ